MCPGLGSCAQKDISPGPLFTGLPICPKHSDSCKSNFYANNNFYMLAANFKFLSGAAHQLKNLN
jgi:hypothetical protein